MNDKAKQLTEADHKIIDLKEDQAGEQKRRIIFGYSETAILRAMGSMGFRPKEAIKAFHIIGIEEFAEGTVRTQVSQWNKRGKIPELNEPQRRVLEKIHDMAKAA